MAAKAPAPEPDRAWLTFQFVPRALYPKFKTSCSSEQARIFKQSQDATVRLHFDDAHQVITASSTSLKHSKTMNTVKHNFDEFCARQGVR